MPLGKGNDIFAVGVLNREDLDLGRGLLLELGQVVFQILPGGGSITPAWSTTRVPGSRTVTSARTA